MDDATSNRGCHQSSQSHFKIFDWHSDPITSRFQLPSCLIIVHLTQLSVFRIHYPIGSYFLINTTSAVTPQKSISVNSIRLQELQEYHIRVLFRDHSNAIKAELLLYPSSSRFTDSACIHLGPQPRNYKGPFQRTTIQGKAISLVLQQCKANEKQIFWII